MIFIPNLVLLQDRALLLGERNGRDRTQAHIAVALVESRVIDAIQLELVDDFFECFFVGNANQDDRRREGIDALRERIGHFKCSVICLHDLCSDWEVLPDEEVKVRVDLAHIQDTGPKRRICQELFWWGRGESNSH